MLMTGIKNHSTSGSFISCFEYCIYLNFPIRCLAHIFNLAVTDVLRALTKEAPESEAAASTTTYSEADLTDPVVALRGLICAVCSLFFFGSLP